MANFNPIWNMKLDSTTIKEGLSTYARLQMTKAADDTGTQYVLDSDQYLKINYTITLTGDTVRERDYTVKVGESTSTLVPIANANTGNVNINGSHLTRLTTSTYTLSSTITSVDAFLIQIYCVPDGIYDNPQSMTITLNSVQVYTEENSEVQSISDVGIIQTPSVILTYNTSDDFWITPDLTTHGVNLYTIGAIQYGAESRLFIQAVGQSTANDSTPTHVFVPAYELETMLNSEMPSTHITGSGTVLNAYYKPNSRTNEEVGVYVKDVNGTEVESSLTFSNNNGQFLQQLLYESDPVDAYFKVKIANITDYYNTEKDAYYLNKRFKAYYQFVAPSDVSYIQNPPTPGHLYILKDTKVYPYVVKESTSSIPAETVLFEKDRWIDLGIYDTSLGADIVGKTKIFRIVMNDNSGNEIVITTEPNLGEVHVGEYFGHSVYPKIEATGSDLITFTLDPESTDDITKYNLNLSADGFITGTAYCRSTDFDSNDDNILNFNVIATAKNGLTAKKAFVLTIIRGFGENYISSYLNPSAALERSYFQSISTSTFSSASYYRLSDDRYGLQKRPVMLLKENFFNPNNTVTDINIIKKNLRTGLINTTNGAIIPDGTFKYVLGNYKLQTALDNAGKELYDVLYREILPYGTVPSVDLNPREYNEEYENFSEIYGLRGNIYNLIGQDIVNLSLDPDDLANRSVPVPAIESISSAMVDTVPRFMVHPVTTDGVTPSYKPILVVAYLEAGTGDAFFNSLFINNEHSTLVGSTIDVQHVLFKYFTSETSKYVEQTFAIPIPAVSLI